MVEIVTGFSGTRTSITKIWNSPFAHLSAFASSATTARLRPGVLPGRKKVHRLQAARIAGIENGHAIAEHVTDIEVVAIGHDLDAVRTPANVAVGHMLDAVTDP